MAPTTLSADPVLLLVTPNTQLRDEIALIAAVVGSKLEVRPSWSAVEPQLIQDSAALLCSAETPPSTTRLDRSTLLVGPDQPALWQTAAASPSIMPVPLPSAERWLSEYLSTKVLDRSSGLVVGVVGALGGVGATTFAYLMAAEATVRGSRALLLDALAGAGSGVNYVVQQARARGALVGDELAMSQLAGAEGEISAAHLQGAVPVVDGVHMLTAGPEVDASQMTARLPSAVRAGRRAYDLVVVDLGRGAKIPILSEQLDSTVVVSRATSRGADAISDLLHPSAKTQRFEQRTAVVLNGHHAPGWGVLEIQEAVGLPVLTELAYQRWLAKADDPTTAYELLRTRHGARLVDKLLHHTGLSHG